MSRSSTFALRNTAHYHGPAIAADMAACDAEVVDQGGDRPALDRLDAWAARWVAAASEANVTAAELHAALEQAVRAAVMAAAPANVAARVEADWSYVWSATPDTRARYLTQVAWRLIDAEATRELIVQAAHPDYRANGPEFAISAAAAAIRSPRGDHARDEARARAREARALATTVAARRAAEALLRQALAGQVPAIAADIASRVAVETTPAGVKQVIGEALERATDTAMVALDPGGAGIVL
jgi:hypothetical protein